MNASKLEQNLTGVIVEMALKMGLSRAPAGRASRTAGG